MDKVRRLLDDLSRRGSNAYHGFLLALRNAGYDFLASKIVENEKIVRREIEEKEREKRKKSEERECCSSFDKRISDTSSSTISQDDDMIDSNLSTISNQTGMDVDH